MENTWQVCPKCDGNKKIRVSTGLTTITHYVENCNICNGFGIVSKETGLPPSNNEEMHKEYPIIDNPYIHKPMDLYMNDCTNLEG